jgi:rubrerythrin
MMETVVKAGGIYWRCNNCRRSGVIGADSELAKSIRLTSKTPAPEPIGIDFNPEQCPVCSGKVKPKEGIDELT